MIRYSSLLAFPNGATPPNLGIPQHAFVCPANFGVPALRAFDADVMAKRLTGLPQGGYVCLNFEDQDPANPFGIDYRFSMARNAAAYGNMAAAARLVREVRPDARVDLNYGIQRYNGASWYHFAPDGRMAAVREMEAIFRDVTLPHLSGVSTQVYFNRRSYPAGIEYDLYGGDKAPKQRHEGFANDLLAAHQTLFGYGVETNIYLNLYYESESAAALADMPITPEDFAAIRPHIDGLDFDNAFIWGYFPCAQGKRFNPNAVPSFDVKNPLWQAVLAERGRK